MLSNRMKCYTNISPRSRPQLRYIAREVNIDHADDVCTVAMVFLSVKMFIKRIADKLVQFSKIYRIRNYELLCFLF